MARKREFAAALVVLGFLIAAVLLTPGEGPQSQAGACAPAPGTGVMGACAARGAPRRPTAQLPVLRGPFVPDVSEFQGRPNWSAAKPHIAGAIARVADLATGIPDRSFAYNWRELRRLHIWHAAYAFLRPGNCAAEADRARAWISAAGGLDSGPLVADAEVPLPVGCARSFEERVEAKTGWHICLIYSSEGTDNGQLHDDCAAWDAAYGPRAGCPWPSCRRAAWQFTDGEVGPLPHCVTGIGCGDISRDEGITALVRPKPKPPGPTPAEIARRKAALALQAQLRALLSTHHCRKPPWKHPHPNTRSYVRVCSIWLAEGRKVGRESAGRAE